MDKLEGIIFIIIFLVAASGFTYQETQINEKKDDLLIYVNAAVMLIENEGPGVFPQFYTPDWFKGDKYIFIWRMDGVRVVYPPEPEKINQDMSNLKDYEGKPIGEIFLETARSGDGWVEYLWPKPGDTHPSRKVTYIKRADYGNSSYLVGAGVYI